MGFMVSNPTYLRLMVEVLTTGDLGQPGQPPEAGSSTPPRWAPLADAMTRAQRDGDLRSFDTRTYAIALGGALDGVFAEALSDPGYTTSTAPSTISSTSSIAPPRSGRQVDRRAGSSYPSWPLRGRFPSTALR